MKTILNLLKPNKTDREELAHLAASAKFGAKLTLSVVAVCLIGCVGFGPLGFMAGTMIGDALDLIWDGKLHNS
jgi:hypothetical protein